MQCRVLKLYMVSDIRKKTASVQRSVWKVQNFREVSIRKTHFTNKIYVK